MLAPVVHIQPLTAIRRERLLPLPGRVLVRKGQKVGANDVVAEAQLAPEHLLMDIGRGLGVPAAQCDQHMQVKPGTHVAEGDVLAGPVGLGRRVVRAPSSGRVMLVADGQVLLEIDREPDGLRAGFPGTVVDLVDDRGIILETTGALIQGVWGNGGIDFGLLLILAHEPGETITRDALDVSMRGAVILAGHLGDGDVFKAAADLPLRGMILASIDPSASTEAQKARFPVIVIEGFGPLPMNPVAYKLLTTNERREVALNAAPWDPFLGARPEIVIPLPASGELPQPQDASEFTAGQQVRITRAPYASRVGILVEIVPGMAQLPNGLAVSAAEVRLENGETVMVPLANLEVMT